MATPSVGRNPRIITGSPLAFQGPPQRANACLPSSSPLTEPPRPPPSSSPFSPCREGVTRPPGARGSPCHLHGEIEANLSAHRSRCELERFGQFDEARQRVDHPQLLDVAIEKKTTAASCP